MKTKKIIIMISILLIASFLCIYFAIHHQANVSKVAIDYGYSQTYTKEDMNEAIKLIKREFSKWNGCELHNIAYSSDERNNEDTISWMNELGKDKEFTECIMFTSNFHSPKNGGGGWNADEEYTNYQWWLARKENGKWELLTWGY